MDFHSLSKIHSGAGRIAVSLHVGKAVISELSSRYPLKLLSPYIHDETALVYFMTYGGGLVGGDRIDLDLKIQIGAKLVLLSQGTTKVFKARFERRLASVEPSPNDKEGEITKQNLRCHVGADGLLVLLPDPVTCFRDASYHQCQQFHLETSGSAVILDWITSGRMSIGEEWVFSRYHSVNEVFREGKRIAKDVMLLDDRDSELGRGIPPRPLSEQLKPYSCYATLFLLGPHLLHIISDVMERYNQITVFKTRTPEKLIWSLSPIDSVKHGIVVRVAGVETETVKVWLRETLSGLEGIIGRDAYKRAFQDVPSVEKWGLAKASKI